MLKLIKYVFYSATLAFVSLAMVRVVTGVNLTDPKQFEHGAIRVIEPGKLPTTWDAENRRLSSDDGSITIKSIDIQDGRTGTYKRVAIVHYSFTAGERPIKPRDLLVKHFSVKQGEHKLLEGMMNEASPAELIEAQNNSILVAERGANLELVEVYELRMDDLTPVELTENVTPSTVLTTEVASPEVDTGGGDQ